MEVGGEPVIACGDTSKVLEPVEHAFDGIAAPVKVWREAVFPDTVDLGRDIGCRALCLDLPAHSVGVVSLVGVHQIGSGYLIEQGIGGDTIGHLSAGDQEGDGAAVSVG